MPIEIRELIIKTTIDDGTRKNSTSESPINVSALKERIIEECLERINEMLERKEER